MNTSQLENGHEGQSTITTSKTTTKKSVKITESRVSAVNAFGSMSNLRKSMAVNSQT